MTLIQFTESSPVVWLMLGAIGLSCIVLLLMFLIGARKSKRGFWAYVAHLDASYPIKPNSRSMYRKLSSVSNNVSASHSANQELLDNLATETRAIRAQLQEVMKDAPLPRLKPVVQSVEELLAQLKEAGGEPDPTGRGRLRVVASDQD